MGRMSDGATAVLIELLRARDEAGVVNELEWDRSEWAKTLSQMVVTAFEAAREARSEGARERGADPRHFGTPFEKIPLVLARANSRLMAPWQKGERLELAAELLVTAAQYMLMVEEVTNWAVPEDGVAAELEGLKEFMASHGKRSPVGSHLN